MMTTRIELIQAFFEELNNKKFRSSMEEQEFKVKFFRLLEKEIIDSDRFIRLENYLKSIVGTFDIIEQESIVRAEKFYSDVKEEELQKYLINTFKKMDSCIRKEEFKSACKFLIIQVETLVDMIQPEAIEWALSNNHKYAKKVKTNEFNQKKELPFINRCEVVSEFLKTERISISTIRKIYSVRNYDSHACWGKDAYSRDIELRDVSVNYRDYFREAYILIKGVKPHIG